jgi:hypothetical protein
MFCSSISPKRLPQSQRKSVPPAKIAARPVRMQATAANPSAGIPLQARLPGREPAARLELNSVFAQTRTAALLKLVPSGEMARGTHPVRIIGSSSPRKQIIFLSSLPPGKHLGF